MEKKMGTVVAAVLLVVVVVIAAYFFATHSSSGTQNLQTSVATNNSAALFSQSRYASSAYLISGNGTANLSPSGKVATSDFNLTERSLQNDSILYTMTFSEESGISYNVTITPSEKLYYIDTNLADDVHGSDLSFGDDGYAVVNATGYMVSVKYPLVDT